MENRKALLIGATGLVGRALLSLLLEDERYEQVRVLTRRPTELESPKLDERVIDFDDLESHIRLLACHDVYCAMGITLDKAGSFEKAFQVEFTYPYQVAQLALMRGAKRFILCSTTGAKPNSSNYYLRTKGRLEYDLSELRYEELHVLRPSILLGERNERRLFEEVGKWLAVQLESIVPKRYKGVEALTVAAFMVSAAFSGNQGVNFYESEVIRQGMEEPENAPLDLTLTDELE